MGACNGGVGMCIGGIGELGMHIGGAGTDLRDLNLNSAGLLLISKPSVKVVPGFPFKVIAIFVPVVCNTVLPIQIEVVGSITESIAGSMIAPASTGNGTEEGNVILGWGAVKTREDTFPTCSPPCMLECIWHKTCRTWHQPKNENWQSAAICRKMSVWVHC